ncbi:hypothetical protein HK104_005687 [Borealophlyctis nickersoniae]|nr:hypothetical protein HK104_005687 [Borealophlyctis nickersoniae]
MVSNVARDFPRTTSSSGIINAVLMDPASCRKRPSVLAQNAARWNGSRTTAASKRKHSSTSPPTSPSTSHFASTNTVHAVTDDPILDIENIRSRTPEIVTNDRPVARTDVSSRKTKKHRKSAPPKKPRVSRSPTPILDNGWLVNLNRPGSIPSPLPKTRTPKMPKVTFTWPHGGTTVIVTGTFDNWSQSHPLHKRDDGSGVFTGSRVFTHAEHAEIQYKFVVDGVWRADHDAPQCADGHGGVNNLLRIEREEVGVEGEKGEQVVDREGKEAGEKEMKDETEGAETHDTQPETNVPETAANGQTTNDQSIPPPATHATHPSTSPRPLAHKEELGDSAVDLPRRATIPTESTPLLRDSDTRDFNAIAHPSPQADTTAAEEDMEEDDRTHMEESELHSAVLSPHEHFASVNPNQINRAELLLYLKKYLGAVNVKVCASLYL